MVAIQSLDFSSAKDQQAMAKNTFSFFPRDDVRSSSTETGGGKSFVDVSGFKGGCGTLAISRFVIQCVFRITHVAYMVCSWHDQCCMVFLCCLVFG